jgi:hypothetical protein
MVQCVAAYMNCCYLVRRNYITTSDITLFKSELARFHRLRQVFIDTGVRTTVELPRSHALMHYADGIELFGSPNGICSSITEAKHIVSIKDTWRRSSRNQPLPQMLRTITREEKLTALRTVFKHRNMLSGTLSSYMTACREGNEPLIYPFGGLRAAADSDESDDEDIEAADIIPGADGNAFSVAKLAARQRMSELPLILQEC